MSPLSPITARARPTRRQGDQDRTGPLLRCYGRKEEDRTRQIKRASALAESIASSFGCTWSRPPPDFSMRNLPLHFGGHAEITSHYVLNQWGDIPHWILEQAQRIV